MFVEASKELTMDQADEVEHDFINNWGETKYVTSQRIKPLKDFLLKASVDLPYRLVKAFITEGCYHVSQVDFGTDEEQINMVNDTLEAIHRIIGTSGSTVSIAVEDRNAILATVLAKFREVKANATAMEESMKATFGENAFDIGPYDVWEKFADMADTDTARAAWMQCRGGSVKKKLEWEGWSVTLLRTWRSYD